MRLAVKINYKSAAAAMLTAKIYSHFSLITFNTKLQIFPPPTLTLNGGFRHQWRFLQRAGRFHDGWGPRLLVAVAGTGFCASTATPHGNRHQSPQEEGRRRRFADAVGSMGAVLAESPSPVATRLPRFRLYCHGLLALWDCCRLWILRLPVLHPVNSLPPSLFSR